MGLACAPKQYVDPTDAAPVRYRLDITAQFGTGASGTDAAAQALALMAQAGLDAHLELEVQTAREFRDGSLGSLVRFDRAWFEHHLDGQPSQVDDPSGLQGRSVELRSFPGDELLTVDLVEHIAGAPRYGDVLDLVFPVLAPYPPSLDEQERARDLMRWPTIVRSDRALRNTVQVTWHNLGKGTVRGEEAWQLDYTGAWQATARDGEVRAGNLLAGQGEVAGTAWYRATDAELVVHDFQWSRTLTGHYPGSGEGVVELVQEQRFSGRLERVSP